MVQMVELEVAHALTERARIHDYVRVGEQEQFATRPFCALAQCIILSEPAGRKFRDVYDTEPSVLRRHASENLSCAVSRAVVENDKFGIGVILLQHRLQRASYFLCFVPRWNNDGHQRQMGSLAGGYISQISYGTIAAREIQSEKREYAERGCG